MTGAKPLQVHCAAGVVANSKESLNSYAAFVREQNTAMPPSVVAWPGTSPLPFGGVRAQADATFVVLGTIEGRKNHKLLLLAWQQMLARSKSGPAPTNVPKLVIVGRRGWQADDVFKMLDRYDFEGRVEEAGPLDDARLAAVLRGARALLFPSLVEGFGIPMVEALAAGVPVIASDLPVFREIGQGVPELVPALDIEAWRLAIEDYARPVSARRTRQLERLAQFHPPSWDSHFEQIDRLITKLG